MEYKEIFIGSTGTKICLSVWEAGPGCPRVIFIPGTMCHPLFYGEFLDLLASRGLNVIGVHLISHGKSPRGRRLFSVGDMKRPMPTNPRGPLLIARPSTGQVTDARQMGLLKRNSRAKRTAVVQSRQLSRCFVTSLDRHTLPVSD